MTTLLDYQLLSSPEALETGATSTLYILIKAPQGQTVLCSSVLVTVPYGNTVNALFQSTPTAKIDQGQGWQLIGSNAPHPDKAVFSLNNTNPGSKVDGVIMLKIQGQIQNQMGLASIDISEKSENTAAPGTPSFTVKNTTISAYKSASPLFLSNFMASDPQQPLVPKTDYENGQQLQLNWDSNASHFEVYQGGDDKPLYSGEASQFTTSLTRATTFTLKARSEGNEAVLYRTLSIFVTNPDLTPKTLKSVDGASPVAPQNLNPGDVSVAGKLAVTHQVSGVGICPLGTVIMYHGDMAQFDTLGAGTPGTTVEGWQVCNGNNNSPDLRDRFIVGAGTTYALNGQGGEDTTQLTIDNLPTHDHGGKTSTNPTGVHLGHVCSSVDGGTSYGYLYVEKGNNAPGAKNKPHQIPRWPDFPVFDSIQDPHHHHNITAVGKSQPFTNLPPYYALYYLIKIS